MNRKLCFVSLIRQHETVLSESKPGWFGDYILLTAAKVDYRGVVETVFYVRRCKGNQAVLGYAFYPTAWAGQRGAYEAALRYFRLRCGGLRAAHAHALVNLAPTDLYCLEVWERHAGHESCYMGGWLISSEGLTPLLSVKVEIDDLTPIIARSKRVSQYAAVWGVLGGS